MEEQIGNHGVKIKMTGFWRFVVASFCLVCVFLTGGCASKKIIVDGSIPDFGRFDDDAKSQRSMRIIFVGGPITWGANASTRETTSYKARLQEWFAKRYPGTPIEYQMVVLPGGSKQCLFELDTHVINQAPDLVFLELTAEDNPEGTDREGLVAYEVILRKLIRKGIPAVAIMAGHKNNFSPEWKLGGPNRVRDHAEMGRLYKVPTANTFPVMEAMFEHGTSVREDIWPENFLFPNDSGHQIIFEETRKVLEQALEERVISFSPLNPVFAHLFARYMQLEAGKLPLDDGWHSETAFSIAEGLPGGPTRLVASASQTGAPPAPLQFNFSGTMVSISGEGDEDGLDYEVMIDGRSIPYYENKVMHSEWPTSTTRFGGGKLPFWRELSDGLLPGKHVLTITPVFPDNKTTGQLRIEKIMFAGE